MGQEPGRVSGQDVTPEQRMSRLQAEIEATRSRLATTVSELDRRRHEILDLKAQLRRHGLAIAGVAAAVSGAVAAAVALSMRRARARRRPTARARRLAEAFSRMQRHPDRVARGVPGPGRKALASAASAAAALAAKRLAGRLLPGREGGRRSHRGK